MKKKNTSYKLYGVQLSSVKQLSDLTQVCFTFLVFLRSYNRYEFAF